jgi:hypothetical protein
MKNLENFLVEVKQSKKNSEAAEKAKELGYKFQSHGVWMDPTSGSKYKWDKGMFKPLESNQKPIKAEDGEIAPGKNPNDPQSVSTPLGTQVLKAPEPGQETPPASMNQGRGWEPGPDGDHCVGGGEEPKPEGIPKDSFVNKGAQDPRWTSGPEGDNYKTFDEEAQVIKPKVKKEKKVLSPEQKAKEKWMKQADKLGALLKMRRVGIGKRFAGGGIVDKYLNPDD